MLRFLRKYNQKILVVGMSLLMVAFLVQGSINQFSGASPNSTYLRMDGGRVTLAEAGLAPREFLAMNDLTGGSLRFMLSARAEDDHWLLLTRAAEREGFVAGPRDGRATLETMIARMAQGTDPEALIERLAANHHLTVTQLEMAAAKANGVMRMRQAYGAGLGRISDRRALGLGAQQLGTAYVDAVFVPATYAAAALPDPDEAALAAHFEKYRAVRPGEGEFGVGYTLPPRAKVEWLVIDRAAIAAGVRADAVEARRRFLRENPGATAEQFEAARGAIEESLKTARVDELMQAAEAAMRAELARATLRLPRRGEGVVLPDDWAQQRPSLERLRDVVAERVRAQTGATIPAPAVEVRVATWLTQAELTGLPGIGSAWLPRGTSRLPFAQAVLGTSEAGGAGSGVQVGLTSPEPARDQAGNLYFFTVLAARPESPADSVEDVRAQAIADWKKIQGFDVLRTQAEAYRQRAISEGLDAIAAETVRGPDGAFLAPLYVQRAVKVQRRQASAPNLNVAEFRDPVMAAAEKLDPRADQAQLDPDQTTLALPLAPKLGLAIARVTAYRPLTIEDYRNEEPWIVQELRPELGPEHDPFTPENLRKRLKVEMATDVAPAKREDGGDAPAEQG
ncbi:MAG TPA: hypothetical protein VD963_11585 [Phycisphaerales bacterium]|nr:hypothetical protein [Phycisphaerales bacterium]